MPDADLQDLLAQCIDRIAEVGRVSAAETVLAAHPEHAAVLRDRLGKLLRAGLLPVAAEPAPAGHPERLGDFLLVRQLGRGGMGVVYLARQESLGRDVALKLVHPELLYFPGARERFRREVEAVARLQDPGIVPIYTVGEDDGVPYFAMEYVGGATLADILGDLHRRQPGSLTGDELHRLVAARAGRDGDAATELFAGTWVEVGCRIVRRMALAAHHAHERGVLHRDIKPSNAMLTPDGRVLLLDFGLAAADGTSSLTRSGAVVGTLHYMAPEQLRGEAMDARTDVYALGATLYELLALETPHRADTADGLRHAILHGAIAPLRARDHGVPRDVETIVRRALDLEPARRYASAAALAEDLERFLQRRPVLARRAGPALRARRWMQRHPAWATAVLLIVLGSGAVGVVAWQRESARRESAANLDNALRAIGTLLDRARDPRLAMTPGLDPVRAQQLDDAVDLLLRLHRENDGSRAVRFALAHGLLQAAELRSTLGDAQRSLDAAALAVTELEALRGEDPDNTRVRVESARGQRARATARRQLADLPGARTDTERGLAVLAERGEAKDPEALAVASACHADLAMLDLADRHPEPALAHLQVARALDDRRLAADRSPSALLDAIRTRTNFAAALEQLGRTADALAELEALRALHTEALAAGPNNPEARREDARNHVAVAKAYRGLQRFDEALRECAAAAAGYEVLVKEFPQRPAYAWERSMVEFEAGQTAEAAGRGDAAIAHYRDALARHTALIAGAPEQHEFASEGAVFATRLAALLQLRAEDAEVERVLRQGLRWQEPIWALNPADANWYDVLRQLRNQLGRHLLDHDRPQDAVPLFAAMVEAAPRDPDPDTGRARQRHAYAVQMLAVAHAMADDPEPAVAALGRLLELAPTTRAQLLDLGTDLHLADRADFQALLARAK